MRKIILSSCILCTLFSINPDGFTKNSDETKFKIERLDLEKSSQKINRVNSNTNFGYTLSDDVSCYVVDESELASLEKNNVTDYLKNGGSIIINDKNVKMSDITKVVDVSKGELDFLNISNTYGSFLYQNKDEIKINSYTVSFVEEQEKLDNLSKEEINQYVYAAENSVNVEDIIDWITKIIEEILKQIGDSKDKEDVEENEEYVLGNATCYNLLYGLISKRRMCSYKINSEVKQGQKYLDKNGKRRGIYDITATYIVGAEEGFRIRKYQPIISSNDEIMDATFLHSDVTEQCVLSGNLGFDGTKVGANINYEYGYQVATTGQDISNTFDFYNNKCSWMASPTKSDNYNESYELQPGVRILSEDDTSTMEVDLSLKKFIIKGTLITYVMVDSCRKTLHL